MSATGAGRATRGVGVVGCAGVLVATVALGGCSDKPAIGSEGRLSAAAGVVVTGTDGSSRTGGGRTLRKGDVVTVGATDSAHIDLPGGASLDLGPRTTLAVDGGPELRSGDALVVAPTGAQVLRVGESTLEASGGAARATVDYGLSTTVYTGAATVTSGGRSLRITALRAAAVPALGLVPAEPTPLSLDASDPWDRRFLADVLDQREPLESRARGFRGQVGGGAKTVGAFRRLLPALEQQPAYQQESVDRGGDAGEDLLAAAIALLGKRADFGQRYTDALAFHADGAPWSLVARDQQVPSLGELVSTIDEAINRQAADLALAVPVTPTPTTTSPTIPGATTSTTRRGTTTSTTAPGSTPTTRPTTSTTRPSTTPTTAPQPEPEPEPGLLTPLLDPVVQLLNQLGPRSAAPPKP